MLRTTKKNLREEQTNDKRALRVAIALLVLLILLPLSTLGQGNTDWHDPTQTDRGFWKAWRAFSDDHKYAYAWWDAARCYYWGYDFEFEPGVQVVGVEVRLDWHSTVILDTSMDVELSWDGGSSWTPAKSDAATLLEHTTILGGSDDIWGHAWNGGEFSDANFRVRLTCNVEGLLITNIIYLDWVAVRVYYTSEFSMEISSGQQVRFPTITGPGMYTSVNNTTFRITSPESWSISDEIIWDESRLDGAMLPDEFDRVQVAALLTRDYDDAYQVPNGAAGGSGQHTFDVAYRLDLTGDNLRYFLAGAYSLVIRYTATPDG